MTCNIINIRTIATITELLASSLAALRQVQQNGDFTIIKSSKLSLTHLKTACDPLSDAGHQGIVHRHRSSDRDG